MARTKSLQDDRFRLIWAFLLWEGHVGNARLRQVLDLETVQVSRLLTAFNDAYPGVTSADRVTKRYVYTGREAPKEVALPSLEEYLAIVDRADAGGPWLNIQTSFAPRPDPRMFARIQSACSESKGLKVNYASLSSPDGAERTIFPHAIANVGSRWIIRAWCNQRNQHVDFLLDRMLSLSAVAGPEKTLPKDDLWVQTVDLRLAAHHAHPENFSKLVQRHFFGGLKTARRTLRKPLVPYYLQEMRIAVDPEKELPPAFQLQLINPEAVRGLLFPPLENREEQPRLVGWPLADVGVNPGRSSRPQP